ncbi:hypothetical protein [Streptomyces sp. CT34]|uniref:hypothetical protein n=1 Tax=Streptomyces sp. CT34 TaxID=1553907 RepID=UPI0005BAD1AA|nr:hypothetical protein [Streptomyces sp. CT34]
MSVIRVGAQTVNGTVQASSENPTGAPCCGRRVTVAFRPSKPRAPEWTVTKIRMRRKRARVAFDGEVRAPRTAPVPSSRSSRMYGGARRAPKAVASGGGERVHHRPSRREFVARALIEVDVARRRQQRAAGARASIALRPSFSVNRLPALSARQLGFPRIVPEAPPRLVNETAVASFVRVPFARRAGGGAGAGAGCPDGGGIDATG